MQRSVRQQSEAFVVAAVTAVLVDALRYTFCLLQLAGMEFGSAITAVALLRCCY